MGMNGSCCSPGGKRCQCTDRKDPEFKRIREGSTDGMVLLSEGSFLMGTDDELGFKEDGEGPIREVHLAAYYIDRHTVTNRQFDAFVKATGYVTDAEAFGFSFVFTLLLDEDVRYRLKILNRRLPGLPWWFNVKESWWKQPEGPESTIEDRWDHPVTHISHRDAMVYAEWAGKRLPTEAEFEFAARGGFHQKRFGWGDELTPDGQHKCNIWQGRFPRKNTMEDGYLGTSPVGTYDSNGYGLFDMTGNVWQWCFEVWSTDFHVTGSRDNPIGPTTGDRRLMRGGSYLCHESYCNRYRVAARTSNTPDSSTGNLGFRCVRDV